VVLNQNYQPKIQNQMASFFYIIEPSEEELEERIEYDMDEQGIFTSLNT
jgi:hypothetical protein